MVNGVMSSSWTLVTGANGFIGARLVRRLVERGEHVKALVRAGADLTALKDLPTDQVRIAVGDCRYEDRVYAALRGCDTMYHVAATYSFNERERARILDNSILGAESSLEAARRASVSKIVFTSSAITLGSSVTPEPLDETSFLSVSQTAASSQMPSYAEAKLKAEQVALRRAEQGQPIVIVNPAAVFGRGDRKPTPSGAQVVAYLNHSPSFKVPIVPGGFGVVDVDDVADGHMAAMDKGRIGERYVLASENFDLRAFYQLLADISGLAEPGADVSLGQANLYATVEELRSWWGSRAPLLTRKLVASYYNKYMFVSSDKAKNELGFAPRPAREALTRACHYFIENGFVDAKVARRARLELRAV